MIITNSNVKTASSGSYEKTVAQSVKMVEVRSSISANGSEVGAVQLGASAASRSRFDYFEFSDRNNAFLSQSGQNGVTPELLQNWENSDFLEPSEQQPQLTDSNSLIMRGNPVSALPKIYTPDEMKLELLRQMIAALKGESFRPNLLNREAQNLKIEPIQIQPLIQTRVFTLMREEYTYESQTVSYSATGVVNTADGKTINFNVNMNMSRSTETYLREELGFMMTARAIDPLIINYAGTAASLTDEKFDFDLDMDGNLDKISFAGQGSGFLALDKNGDGIINDGSELFGPQNGDGFAELRKYDLDGNGWIDEADEVYSKLRIWCKDKDGNDILYTLKELDIGAIYLYENKTDFAMYDSKGNAQGDMRATSFFLKDSGGAGTISHFDLLA